MVSLPVSLWLSMALCDSHSGSLWLPLALTYSLRLSLHWLSLALTATLWHTLALSGSLLLSNFAYKAVDRLTGPLFGSHRVKILILIDLHAHIPELTLFFDPKLKFLP